MSNPIVHNNLCSIKYNTGIHFLKNILQSQNTILWYRYFNYRQGEQVCLRSQEVAENLERS